MKTLYKNFINIIKKIENNEINCYQKIKLNKNCFTKIGTTYNPDVYVIEIFYNSYFYNRKNNTKFFTNILTIALNKKYKKILIQPIQPINHMEKHSDIKLILLQALKHKLKYELLLETLLPKEYCKIFCWRNKTCKEFLKYLFQLKNKIVYEIYCMDEDDNYINLWTKLTTFTINPTVTED